jgi:isopentenyl-diphosphate Delta-isomerase
MGNLNTNARISRVSDTDVPLETMNRRDLPEHPANFRVAHVFVFNRSGELLLQHIAPGQRSEGRWGSSAAGYVLAGEAYPVAARRKLAAELGVRDVIPRALLKTSMPDLGATKFITLFTALSEGPFALDAEQATGIRFATPDEVEADIAADPESFTATFRHLWGAYRAHQGGAP